MEATSQHYDSMTGGPPFSYAFWKCFKTVWLNLGDVEFGSSDSGFVSGLTYRRWVGNARVGDLGTRIA